MLSGAAEFCEGEPGFIIESLALNKEKTCVQSSMVLVLERCTKYTPGLSRIQKIH